MKGLIKKYQKSTEGILKAVYSVVSDSIDGGGFVRSSELVFNFVSKLNFKMLQESLKSIFPETTIEFNCKTVPRYI